MYYADPAVSIILQIVFGGICAVVANGRGRSGVAWFLIGFLLGCIGLIILLVIPDLRLEQERKGGIALDIDALDRVHLKGDFKSHGVLPGI